jgi:hypothetical protein
MSCRVRRGDVCHAAGRRGRRRDGSGSTRAAPRDAVHGGRERIVPAMMRARILHFSNPSSAQET